MDSKSMTRAEQIAHHRAELERLEAEEKAARPALAAGQVWRSPNFGLRLITTQLGGGKYSLDLLNADHMPYSGTQLDDCFEFVGLARDVLRVVEPEVSAPPESEPTGAELVGKRCWVGGPEEWLDRVVTGMDGSYYKSQGPGGTWFHRYVKLYREGVAP